MDAKQSGKEGGRRAKEGRVQSTTGLTWKNAGGWAVWAKKRKWGLLILAKSSVLTEAAGC